MTGLVFDIQRFSLHDGPGICTTVFLKGCPLRCQWCHNPESQARHREIGFRPEACVACGACAEVCEHGAHHVNGQHVFDRTLCVRCAKCVPACLYEALSVAGYERSVDEVLAEVSRDVAYYRKSGGGLTLSGGEPMFQREFALALLQATRQAGIHTCLETCGQAPRSAYEAVLPLVDLFLFDIKATDPEVHRRLTGVSNALILSNLEYLCTHGARVRLRCPLIPGVNDDEAHLQGIAALERRYPALEGIELMPYHNVGNDKYRRFGLTNPLPDIPTTEEATKTRWLETLKQLEAANVMMS